MAIYSSSRLRFVWICWDKDGRNAKPVHGQTWSRMYSSSHCGIPAPHAAQHRGWYTFFINTAAGAVYTFGQRLSRNRWHRTATDDCHNWKVLTIVLYCIPNLICSCKHCLFCSAAAGITKKQVGFMRTNAEYCNVDDKMFVPVIGTWELRW